MKRVIIPVVIAFGFACVGQAYAAVDAYTVNLAGGYAVQGFVAHTPDEFAQAQVQARGWEERRHLMLVPQTIKAVAIDQSQGTAMNETELKNAIVAAAMAKRP